MKFGSLNIGLLNKHRLFIFLLGLFAFLNALFLFVDIIEGDIFVDIDNTPNVFIPYIEDSNLKDLGISGESYMVAFLPYSGESVSLISHNSFAELPIASITKLMTALVAYDIYEHNDVVEITKESLELESISNSYIVGDKLSFIDAMHAMLIKSHNEVAYSIADKIGQKEFVKLMNKKAGELGLRDTFFGNVTGLDSIDINIGNNQSTTYDVYRLLEYIFKNRADIFSILRKSQYTFAILDSERVVDIRTTNKLIDKNDADYFNIVIGGKTGTTDIALSNLAIMASSPRYGEYIISVVLGSGDSFYETRELLDYVLEDFVWQ